MPIEFKAGSKIKALAGTCLLAATLGVSAAASAAYPDHAIRMVVGFSAGGTTDVVARILGKEIGDALGQPVVVENRPGAGSNIASEMVARAEPDGYTLYMVAVTSAINQTLYKNLRFDLVKDFTPVALAVRVPNVLVVNPKVPAKSVKELVDYAKSNPGKLNFASSGSGTSIHMAGELFKQVAQVDVTHIPYKGSSPAMTDLIGGQVDYMFDNMPSAWPHVEAGKLRALAVTTADRSKTAPDLPTMQESGFPSFDVSSWFGVIAPKGTPDAVVNKLNAVILEALAKPDVQKRMAELGAVPAKTTPAEFGDFIKSEVESWAKVVKASGATVD
ncbi:Bug family tripartite tricarboxylate transporter substrate binding protein [Parapusillimonas granuli]|uniref:Tripartite tricarboxylate transporter substrate binding protein n=1 Tax=Parapusillimonas granuli TaxID=380911 RepID=A0A853FWJ9_9BURK|nr:tripartite tricarboxylate transporter substrate binding protein [Parapusillimonas granuli]MBB5213690.1 tripartite-type tricarboxylate transporter receptor subunit TctC [Parapusillimonas granuli]MEB2398781.1 tripartite tricarboxylate transporter substrate binding protein [Alcaligenaceae bacterium]NYT48527.1 tripartite tricarboxylate transporter substrate binding protein [Parapusillimonas granuli]